MLEISILITTVIAAYLIGSISSAIIVCKIMRLPDPRTAGSNNPGTTNVLRIGGKKAAIITLIGDALKGFVPVKAAIMLHGDVNMIGLAAFAAFLGHLYPIFFKFQGGKGVATSFGVLLALNLPLAIIIAGIWLLIFLIFRISSLAAITATGMGLIYAWGQIPPHEYYALAAISLLLFWRHRSNLERIVKGEEPQFKRK